MVDLEFVGDVRESQQKTSTASFSHPQVSEKFVFLVDVLDTEQFNVVLNISQCENIVMLNKECLGSFQAT